MVFINRLLAFPDPLSQLGEDVADGGSLLLSQGAHAALAESPLYDSLTAAPKETDDGLKHYVVAGELDRWTVRFRGCCCGLLLWVIVVGCCGCGDVR